MKVSKRKKEDRKEFMRDAQGESTFPKCLNCGKPGRHFVAPSVGDVGFFSCDWIGAGSAIDIFGSYFLYNFSPTPEIEDATALKNDWQVVGDDLRSTISEGPSAPVY